MQRIIVALALLTLLGCSGSDPTGPAPFCTVSPCNVRVDEHTCRCG